MQTQKNNLKHHQQYKTKPESPNLVETIGNCSSTNVNPESTLKEATFMVKSNLSNSQPIINVQDQHEQEKDSIVRQSLQGSIHDHLGSTEKARSPSSNQNSKDKIDVAV